MKQQIENLTKAINEANALISELQSFCAHSYIVYGKTDVCATCKKECLKKPLNYVIRKYKDVCECVTCNCTHSDIEVKEYVYYK